ncbi:SDR family NAD(P)-dependent oxidoreductase [Pseudokineococcus basanitobsidens]|uniref:SDR family NAD(P)-dependent oxidoreductase n=1 Tax=Pseudokineococcus basanitobsidens TaxID=1926649 RepID=A0ABU8RPF5_9ACTN
MGEDASATGAVGPPEAQPAASPAAGWTPGRFEGRTAVVTGAGSGIGRATAVRLAREGARVVAVELLADRLDALVAEHGDLDLVPVAADVTTTEGVDAVVAAAAGRVDALANVAGIMDGFLPPAEVDDATWDRVLAVNLTAPMRLCRAVLPGMVGAGAGAVVNVASEAALRGSAAGAAYTASKHGLVGLTKNIAVMHRAQGVRANAVAPGPVATGIDAPMRSAQAAGVVGPLLQAVLTAPAQAEDLAASICWLLSDDAANVNGVVLASDGGWSAV